MKEFSTFKQAAISRAGHKIDGMSRFYARAGIVELKSQGLYCVTLDGKKVKTPIQRKVVQVPNKAHAMALAHEWDSQIGSYGIRPASMPLMTLTTTCLDIENFDSDENKLELINEVLMYFRSDTICFEAPPIESKVRRQQRKVWGKLRDWFENEFGETLDINDGTHMGRLHHSKEASQKVATFLDTHNNWQLSALRTITRECKSLVIALALLKRHLNTEQAIEAARLEEESQIFKWGLVEGGHDLDRLNIRASVSAASTMLWFLRSNHPSSK